MLLTHACILHNMTIGTGRAPAISTQRAFLTSLSIDSSLGVDYPTPAASPGWRKFLLRLFHPGDYHSIFSLPTYLGQFVGGWCYFATDRWGWYLVKVYPGISFLFSTLDVRVDIVFEMKFLRKCIVVTYTTHVFTLRTLVWIDCIHVYASASVISQVFDSHQWLATNLKLSMKLRQSTIKNKYTS